MIVALLRQRLLSIISQPAVALPLSMALLAISAQTAYLHASSIAAVKEQLLPASMEIPGLEQRLNILKQQLEVSELQASLRMQSPEEMLRTYVLPEDPDVTRLLATLDVLRDTMQKDKQLISMEPIVVGTLPADDGTQAINALPLTLRMRVTEEGLERVLTFIQMAGMLTVADAFSKDELNQLLLVTEQENPAAIAQLEPFLTTNMKDYAREPKPFEEQVLRSLSDGPLLEQFTHIIRHGRLAAAKDMLAGPLGRNLIENDLWPLRFLMTKTWTVQTADKGMLDVELGLVAYSR